jgi:hypothetical protein
MTTRCTQIARASALLILTLALFAIPSSTRAQVLPCVCDHYTISVDATVNCDIEVCYQVNQFTHPICIVIVPGGSAQIPCPIYSASITTCRGPYEVIGSPAVARCTSDLQINNSCCIKGCRGSDADGCPLLTITAVPCTFPRCP